MAYSDPRSICSPWITPEELCCEGTQDSEDCNGNAVVPVFAWTDDQIIESASNILYNRTCLKFPGLCEITVWPCPDCNCGCHPCGCGTFSHMELPTDYPIQSITAVRIDGVALDPSDYRLDNNTFLVRMDGQRWPSCNSFGLPNTSSSEIQVDAIVGREPPIELRMAAADLACELKKACSGSEDCSIPPHVRSIARRGVSIQIDDITSLFKDGLFGIPSVDMALAIHGKCSQQGKLFDPLHPGFRGYGVS